MPKKPTGEIGSIKATGGQPHEYLPLVFPSAKREIERVICDGALKSMRGRGYDLWGCRGTPRQLSESDFDFEFATQRGRAFLDLVEFAPLSEHQGQYDRTQPHGAAGDQADAVWDVIKKKSAHYGGNRRTEIHLLIYVTHSGLRLAPDAISLVAIYCSRRTHRFRSVSYYSPISLESGLIEPLFGPTVNVRAVSREEEERLRAGSYVNLDLKSAQPTDDGGLTFG